MKAELVSGNTEKITFNVTGTNTGYLNALRRISTKHVPIMAIETVEFRQNTSVLYDELLAHRLGLLALTTDNKHYVMLDKPSEEFVNNAMVKLTLSAKGPTSVYAKDFKTKDPAIKPVHPKTLLVKLLENQELKAEVIAQLGIGKTHAKWDSGLAFYKDDNGKFTFTLESWGQLPAKDILLTGLKVFNEQLDTVIELSKDLEK